MNNLLFGRAEEGVNLVAGKLGSEEWHRWCYFWPPNCGFRVKMMESPRGFLFRFCFCNHLLYRIKSVKWARRKAILLLAGATKFHNFSVVRHVLKSKCLQSFTFRPSLPKKHSLPLPFSELLQHFSTGPLSFLKAIDIFAKVNCRLRAEKLGMIYSDGCVGPVQGVLFSGKPIFLPLSLVVEAGRMFAKSTQDTCSCPP